MQQTERSALLLIQKRFLERDSDTEHLCNTASTGTKSKYVSNVHCGQNSVTTLEAQ